MTHRLYYNDSYQKDFEAYVLEMQVQDGRFFVRLNQSAFYPTSGGQPHDLGILGERSVLDVYVVKDGEVWHEVDGALNEGECVHGEIDWPRRFDHMQQHAGEHMLAGAVHRLFGGHTIGLHLGKDDSSIDVELPDGRMRLTDEELMLLEDDVNRHIQADVPIRCYFPDPDELMKLPLRKPPTVNEHVRIVQIGDDEFCACGGTHPSSAGQVGLVKIVDARPSRGKMRLTFLCGMRAFLDYRNRFREIEAASQVLSTGWQHLQDAVNALNIHQKDTEYQLRLLKKENALRTLEDIVNNAHCVNGVSIGVHVFDHIGMEGLREAASSFIKEENRIALFADEAESGVLLLFARSENVDIHIGKLLSEAAKRHGGKGGGRADFAQGAAGNADVLQFALTEIQTAFDRN